MVNLDLNGSEITTVSQTIWATLLPEPCLTTSLVSHSSVVTSVDLLATPMLSFAPDGTWSVLSNHYPETITLSEMIHSFHGTSREST